MGVVAEEFKINVQIRKERRKMKKTIKRKERQNNYRMVGGAKG